jgi:hypothetical protein
MKQLLIEKYIEPSEVIIIDGDYITERWFDKNYDLHSFMGHPSRIAYKNKEIIWQEFHKKGELCRNKNLPDFVKRYWDSCHNLSIIYYWRNINGSILKCIKIKINK